MYSTLKAEMARKNLTIVDLSEKTGIRYNTLAAKLKGKYSLTLPEAIAIKNALDVDLSIDELFAVPS